MDDTNKELKPKESETSTDNSQAPESETKEESIKSDADALKNTESDESDKGSEDEKIDYKSELESIKAERDNYKQGLINAKDKLKKSKTESPKGDDDDDSDDDEKVNIDEHVKQIKDELRKEFDQMKEGYLGDYVSDTVNSLSENNDEKELIKYHYNNTLVKSGTSRENIEKDLRMAKLLANQGRFEREIGELKRVLSSERTKERVSDYGSQRDQSSPDIELSTIDKQIVERLANRKNISFEEAKELFIKN